MKKLTKLLFLAAATTAHANHQTMQLSYFNEDCRLPFAIRTDCPDVPMIHNLTLAALRSDFDPLAADYGLVLGENTETWPLDCANNQTHQQDEQWCLNSDKGDAVKVSIPVKLLWCVAAFNHSFVGEMNQLIDHINDICASDRNIEFPKWATILLTVVFSLFCLFCSCRQNWCGGGGLVEYLPHSRPRFAFSGMGERTQLVPQNKAQQKSDVQTDVGTGQSQRIKFAFLKKNSKQQTQQDLSEGGKLDGLGL